MSEGRQRLAWLLLCAILALVSLRVPTGATPTDRDLDFLRTMVEVKREIDGHYVRPVDDKSLRDAAVAGMMSRLDVHSIYIPPRDKIAFDELISGRFTGVGILLGGRPAEATGPLVVVRPIDGGPADKVGVKPGDAIVAVGGVDVTGKTSDESIKLIKGEAGTKVTLTLDRPTKGDAPADRLDLTMERAEVASPVIEGWTRDANQKPVFWAQSDTTATTQPTPVKVGYIRLTGFTQGSGGAVTTLIQSLLDDGMQGLILDLRGNPGGLLNEAADLANALLDGGVIFSAKGEHYPEMVVRADKAGTLPRFPMAVIVNEDSASASEVLSGALGDNGRAVIVGTRSFGKGSVQQIKPLSDGGEVKLTQAYYYLPSGRLVDRRDGSTDWGVIPDVLVPVDYKDPAEVGDVANEPPYPRQVRAAYNVLVGLVAAQTQGTASTRPTTAATR